MPINEKTVFEKDKDIIWECANCGHVYIGPKALELCPVCKHPQAYFAEKANNY